MKHILVIYISIAAAFSCFADIRLSYSATSESWSEPKSREITESRHPNGVAYSSSSDRGEFSLECDKDSSTLYYMMKSTESGDMMEARLDGSTIVVDLIQGGAEQHLELQMEKPLPWYQSFDLQFSDFALSGEKKREFYMVRPDEPGLTTWQLKRQGTEKVETPAGTFDAVKVKVSLAGMLSMFWSAECWFRASDGRFIKYEGPSGGPGSDTIVSYLSKEQQL